VLLGLQLEHCAVNAKLEPPPASVVPYRLPYCRTNIFVGGPSVAGSRENCEVSSWSNCRPAVPAALTQIQCRNQSGGQVGEVVPPEKVTPYSEPFWPKINGSGIRSVGGSKKTVQDDVGPSAALRGWRR